MGFRILISHFCSRFQPRLFKLVANFARNIRETTAFSVNPGEFMSSQSYRMCFCFRRRFRPAEAESPAEIKNIFEECSENGVMNTYMLRRFLVEIRGEQNATVEDAQSIMDRLKSLHIFQRRGFNLETFFKYLLG